MRCTMVLTRDKVLLNIHLSDGTDRRVVHRMTGQHPGTAVALTHGGEEPRRAWIDGVHSGDDE